jgi:hypothetical protein
MARNIQDQTLVNWKMELVLDLEAYTWILQKKRAFQEIIINET